MSRRKPHPPEHLSSEMDTFNSAMNDSRDMACVLLGASYLDACLASLLSKALIESEVVGKVLHPTAGTLGTFAGRTDMAYLLGLVTKGLWANLRTVGEIRNLFAHDYLERTFDNAEIAEKCLALTYPHISTGTTPREVAMPPGSPFNSNDPRTRFVTVTVVMANRLLLTALGTKHATRCRKGWEARDEGREQAAEAPEGKSGRSVPGK